MAVAVGLSAGLVSDLIVFKREDHPGASFGLFVVPSVILGVVTVTWTRAVGVGLTAHVFVVLGHFLGARLTEHGQDSGEYGGWLALAFFLGPLLGYLGYLIRSRWKAPRAVATGFLVGLILCPFFFWQQGENYFAENMNSFTIAFDVLLMVMVLALCRGIVVRGVAVAVSVFLSWVVPVFPFLLLTLMVFIGGPE
ncbi:hypothetical protein HNR06_000016 [Nocardiopsis arvandica]|uniref:Uncharacterized protein n=1 Tax=Nocardiopsis sinuspersici TaxID=501010 RepID=A0A7Y9X8L5_9ACTN|nr:DUF6518 family protein [Nocardiopsis sinuspersici]NYH50427.1 hypothetical protein [Nocardiopsis sinuspersici]